MKLRELEVNSKVQLQQLAVTAEQNRLQAAAAQYAAEASDRDSARRLAAQQPKDWIRPTITVLLVLGAAGIVWAILSGAAPALHEGHHRGRDRGHHDRLLVQRAGRRWRSGSAPPGRPALKRRGAQFAVTRAA